MSREDEIDELILYVTDMRRSFTRKFDDQLFIIQQQNERLQRQSRTIDEQKDVVDELAWQIRDLRDSVRRVKETQAQCVCNANNNNPNQPVSQPQPAPRRRADSVENILGEATDDNKGPQSRDTFLVPAPRYARIPFARADAFDQTPTTADNIYECIDSAPIPDGPSSLPAAPRSSLTPNATQFLEPNATPDDRLTNQRTRYALFKHMTYRHSEATLPEADNVAIIDDAIGKLKLELKEERDSFSGTGDDEVMLRISALRRFPRNSQLRGSSKGVSSMVSNIEEEYLPAEDHISHSQTTSGITLDKNPPQREVVSDAHIYYNDPKFPYGKGGSFRV